MPYKTYRRFARFGTGNDFQTAQEIYLEAFNHAWAEYADPKKRSDDPVARGSTHEVALGSSKKTI